MSPNYQTGRIYKIVSDSSDLVYVGSTTTSLAKRMTNHRANFKRYLAGKYHYVTSFKILEQGNCHIILLECVVCENKEQLHAAERRWVEQLDCVNKTIPGRTDAEYHQDNREHNLERMKERYQANRDRLTEKHDCACGGRFTMQHKAVHLRTKKHKCFVVNNPPPAYPPPVN